jgi:hypothetical protein
VRKKSPVGAGSQLVVGSVGSVLLTVMDRDPSDRKIRPGVWLATSYRLSGLANTLSVSTPDPAARAAVFPRQPGAGSAGRGAADAALIRTHRPGSPRRVGRSAIEITMMIYAHLSLEASVLAVTIPVDVHQVMADFMGIAADDLNRAKDAELGMMDLGVSWCCGGGLGPLSRR